MEERILLLLLVTLPGVIQKTSKRRPTFTEAAVVVEAEVAVMSPSFVKENAVVDFVPKDLVVIDTEGWMEWIMQTVRDGTLILIVSVMITVVWMVRPALMIFLTVNFMKGPGFLLEVVTSLERIRVMSLLRIVGQEMVQVPVAGACVATIAMDPILEWAGMNLLEGIVRMKTVSHLLVENLLADEKETGAVDAEDWGMVADPVEVKNRPMVALLQEDKVLPE